MRYLKTNTATIVTVGPFLDKTDGVTLKTALTITNEKISATVDLNEGSAPTLVLDNVTGATSGTSNDLNYITNCDAALMQLELAAANVNYLGRFFLTITDAANHVPVFHEFEIISAQAYDALFSTGNFSADIKVVTAGAINNAAFATDVGSTAYATNIIALAVRKVLDELNLDHIAKVATAAADMTAEVVDATILSRMLSKTSDTSTYDLTTDSQEAIKDALPAAAPLASAIADAVWDEAISGHAGVGSTGEALSDAGAAGTPPDVDQIADAVWDELASGHVGAGSTGAALAAGSIATVDAKVDLILADTDELQTDLVNGGRLDLLIDAILLDTGTTLDGKITVVDGKADTISTAVVTTIPAAVAVVDGIVDAILVDTNELQTMLTPDGTLDVILDSILEDTAALGAIDAAAVADAVWDEALSGHVAAGSAGKGVQDAASAGDPWSTPIPGGYSAGTAGKKISDMVAEVTAILVDTGTTLDGKLDTIDANVDAILVDTGTTLDGKINTIDGIVDDILVDTGTTIPAQITGLSIPSAPPTAAAIADAVWDEVISTGHAVGNSSAVKLMAAAVGLATAQAGLGAVACVITVTIATVPLQDCDVWVTSDEAGATVVAGTLQTNSSGQVTFYLDAGTYYVWQQKVGYNFTNPDTLVVT